MAMIKLQRLVESREALRSLASGLLPIGVAWDLKKFILSIEPEYSLYEEFRSQKVKELGEETSDGFRVKQDNFSEFLKAIQEVLDKDVEVEVPSISVEVLRNFRGKNGEEITISTSDLIILDWLIVE